MTNSQLAVTGLSLLIAAAAGWSLLQPKAIEAAAGPPSPEPVPVAVAEVESPEKKCSSAETYSQLSQIIEATALQYAIDLTSHEPAPTVESLSYSTPMLEKHDEDAKRSICSALLYFPLRESRLIFAMTESPVQVNSRTQNGVTVSIRYSVQPAADDGREIASLWQADELGKLAYWSSMSQRSAERDTTAEAGTASDEPAPEAAVQQQ